MNSRAENIYSFTRKKYPRTVDGDMMRLIWVHEDGQKYYMAMLMDGTLPKPTRQYRQTIFPTIWS